MKTVQVILLVSLIALMNTIIKGQDESPGDPSVEKFLTRLQLDSVLIEHLQQQLNQVTEPAQRVEIARRLAKLYSKEVFSGNGDELVESRFQQIVQLAADFPEIDSPDLRMTILHSRYASAERQFLRWLDQGRDLSTRTDLEQKFRDIGGRLRRQISQLENAIFEGSDARLFAQAHYLYGWVSYYLGILEPAETKTWMGRSNQSFREFLEIDPDKPISQLSAQWFEIQSPWHARAQIGLAMCLQGLDEPDQSKFCFDILESLETDPRVRNQLDIWRLNRFVYLGQLDSALNYLKSKLSDRQQDKANRTRLWVAAVDAASTCRGGMYSEKGARFLRTGLRGLLADMNAPVLRDIVQREKLNIAGEDFLLAWCRGYLSFYQGELTKDPSHFELARKELKWAIHSATSSTDIEDVSKCRFLLGWIEFQLRNYKGASELLMQAIPELTEGSPDLASEAQWIVVRSLQMLSKSDPRYANDAFEEMDRLARLFPHSKYVRRVEFEKLLMEVSKFPAEEAIRRLKKVQREDPNYNDAVFQQIVLQHRVWQDSPASGPQGKQRSLTRLLEMERSFQQLYPVPVLTHRFKAGLLCIDALIRSDGDGHRDAAANRISLAVELGRGLPSPSPLATELRFYQFQLASRDGELKAMEADSQWFYENQPESRYCQSVLVTTAQAIQKEFDSSESHTVSDLERIQLAYRRLSDLLGREPKTLKSSQNARYAAYKLAEFCLRLGQASQAEQILSPLLEAYPQRRSYWLLAARSNMQLTRFQAALDCWRQIVGSTEPGHDDWYEAKLGIVRCLESQNKQAAIALLIQTANLSPNRPQEWDRKFVQQANRLGIRLDQTPGDQSNR